MSAREDSPFVAAFVRGTQGMTGVSSGTCPGCPTCMEIDGYDDDAQKHREAWSTGDLQSGAEDFSWRPCGICGTTLGGNRNVWHWIDPSDPKREINHECDMCDDCALFLANGDEPESWSAS